MAVDFELEKIEKQIKSAENQLAALNEEISMSESPIKYGENFYENIEMMNFGMRQNVPYLDELYESRSNLESQIAIYKEELNKKIIENKNIIQGRKKYLVSINGNRNEANTLKDLRNISLSGQGLNFRKTGSSPENNLNLVSKSYFMNKDFLIIDSLSLKGYDINSSNISETAHGFYQNIEKMSNIQPLILNEFQPYDMLSPADLMPDGILNKLGEIANLTATALGAGVVALGKHYLMKKNVDKFSKNPELLYNISHDIDGKTEIDVHNKSRVRKYLTSDPVQVIQNMFNGGKWLNTFQIPYYGNDYLNANHKRKLEFN